MGKLKQLAGQTAIYGLSTIIGRLLNYLLVPLYTHIFAPGEYGVVTELYAYITFLIVIYHYGMETAFFHFSQKHPNPQEVYNTSFFSLLGSTTIFTAVIIAFAPQIASALQYPDHQNLIYYIALILAFDTIAVVPFTYLRRANKAKKFATVKLLNIGLNIGLNLFFFLGAPYILSTASWSFLHPFVNYVYNPNLGIYYVFISNLIASAVTIPMLMKELMALQLKVNPILLKSMLNYSYPLILVGLAGMINETIDRILLKYLLPGPLEYRMAQVGIYGACYKLSIFMTLAIQAFRFAAEPFFFAQAKEKDGLATFSVVMKYFVIFASLIFLGVMMYIEVVKLIIGPDYNEGLGVVPILLMANLFLGVYYNLSIWYKVTERIKTGAMISVFGAILTLALNFMWIPFYSYTGSAWATLICYASMAVLSWRIGQKYYPVNYPVKDIVYYITTATGLYLLSLLSDTYLTSPGSLLHFIINTFLLLSFMGLVLFREKPKFLLNLHHRSKAPHDNQGN